MPPVGGDADPTGGRAVRCYHLGLAMKLRAGAEGAGARYVITCHIGRLLGAVRALVVAQPGGECVGRSRTSTTEHGA